MILGCTALVLILLPLPPGISQHVSLSSTPEILHVEAPGQNPLNPGIDHGVQPKLGSQEHPFERIQDALDYAQAHPDIPQEIRLGPGVYRESLSLRGQADREMAPLTLRAIAPGSVTLSGSQAWRDWQQEATLTKSVLYSHPWPYDWGVSGNPWEEFDIDFPEIVQRGEMAWQDTERVRQYLSFADLSQATSETGFFVDEESDRLYVRLPQALDIKAALLEVTTQNRGVVMDHIQNVTLDGLIFEHYGGTFTAALAISHGQNIQIRNCIFANNNWAGLSVHRSQQVQIDHSQFHDNGLRGLGGWRIDDLTVQDVETRANNWRGAWGEFYDWDAGEKFFYLRRAHFNRYRAIANQATGLWLDTDNREVLVEHSQLVGNAVAGLFLEAGQGPITIQRCLIAQNYQIAPNYLQTPGVFGWAAQNVTLKNNLIINNDFAQVGVRDLSDRQITIPETGESQTLISKDWHLENNWIISSQTNQFLLITLNASAFLETLQEKNNYWLSPSDLPVRINDQSLTLQAWRDQVSGDTDYNQ